MVASTFGLAPSTAASVFTDCPEGEWFTPYVMAAAEAGYIKGVSETEFAPNDNITREQAFTIVGRALGTEPDAAADMAFTDAASISDYAVPYVRLLVESGVVNGDENGAIRPQDSITRAESAKIIAVVYEKLNADKKDEVAPVEGEEGTGHDDAVDTDKADADKADVDAADADADADADNADADKADADKADAADADKADAAK